MSVAVEKWVDRAQSGEQMGEVQELNMVPGTTGVFAVILVCSQQLRNPPRDKFGWKKSERLCLVEDAGRTDRQMLELLAGRVRYVPA